MNIRKNNMEPHFKKKTGWVNVYKDYDDTMTYMILEKKLYLSPINHLLT